MLFSLLALVNYLWKNVALTQLCSKQLLLPHLIKGKIGKMGHFELLFVTIRLLILLTILDMFYPFLMRKIVN